MEGCYKHWEGFHWSELGLFRQLGTFMMILGVYFWKATPRSFNPHNFFWKRGKR